MSSQRAEQAQRCFTTRSEGETIALARQLGALLFAGAWVALCGELGAGKTRFVQGLAQGLGLDASRVASPTFVLLHVHKAPESAVTLAHIDAYRMIGAEELDTLGVDELLTEGALVVAVEWAERIASAIPDDALRVSLAHAPDAEQARTITLEGPATVWREALAHLHAPLAQGDAHA